MVFDRKGWGYILENTPEGLSVDVLWGGGYIFVKRNETKKREN
jgi:hypothetical protein